MGHEPLVAVSPLGARPGPPEGVFGYGDANSPANPEYGDANSWEDKGSLGMVVTLNAPNTRRTSRKKTPSFRRFFRTFLGLSYFPRVSVG